MATGFHPIVNKRSHHRFLGVCWARRDDENIERARTYDARYHEVDDTESCGLRSL